MSAADNGGERAGADDAGEMARLAALPPLEYDRERDAAAERLGCRVATLDALVEAARDAAKAKTNGAAGAGAGRALASAEIEPWPEAVDGVAMLNELAVTIRRFVVIEPTAADAVALWIVHTHAIDAAHVSPRLVITSPEKRCGKTTLLTLIRSLVARPIATANMTESILFRTIEAMQPTLLIDEADTFIGGNNRIRGIIDAGHWRATATVMCSVPDAYEGWKPRAFNVWGALAIAMIGRPHGTIADRSIETVMRRKRPSETAERLRLDRLDQFVPLARRAMRWADDNHAVLLDADPDVPAELHDRAADNWRPLLAIADAASGDWPECARRAATALSRDGSADADAHGVTLLADLRDLFNAEPRGVLFTSKIVDALCRHEDRPWAEMNRGRPITPHGVAALLRPFGVRTNQTVRCGTITAKGYRAKDFADAWARYLPPV